MHPDTFTFDGSDEVYLKRLQAYANEYGLEETKATICSRPWLLSRLV